MFILASGRNSLGEGFDKGMDYIKRLLIIKGIKENVAGILSYAIVILLILLVCLIIHFILKKVVLRILAKIIRSNKMIWDDIMLEHRVIQRSFRLVPGFIAYMAAPVFDPATEIIRRLAITYILLVCVFVFNALLDTINDVYLLKPISRIRPIKGLLQIIKIIVYIILFIIGIANLMGKSPLILLSGISALAAVYSFVFKDSILGFIAGIQLTSNDMLRIGDWIEMSKYGADGNVIDITLNTVKVQNFDKTIVSIPAYALISDSFKNWRGMLEYGGRRIKRSIYIDVNSITLCTPEMLEKFKNIRYITDYVHAKEEEIRLHNREIKADMSLAINGRQMTNIGTFRAYINQYLKNHPGLRQDIALMVRQLPPAENGLPIEIYAFTKSTDWTEFEGIQSDIFDHILSVAGEFGLRIFQNPTGYDMRQIHMGNGV